MPLQMMRGCAIRIRTFCLRRCRHIIGQWARRRHRRQQNVINLKEFTFYRVWKKNHSQSCNNIMYLYWWQRSGAAAEGKCFYSYTECCECMLARDLWFFGRYLYYIIYRLSMYGTWWTFLVQMLEQFENVNTRVSYCWALSFHKLMEFRTVFNLKQMKIEQWYLCEIITIY